MWIFFTEAMLVSGAVALLIMQPRLLRHPWITRANQFGSRLAANRMLAVCIVFALSLAARLMILPIVPVPEPQNHDEFSYLLAADTFASGRLANPTHPLWRHFETFHIEHQPTYMSMYPPGQGLLLAAAQKSVGVPWAGVLLTTAGMCAAITWLLQSWLPPYWAFVGGLLSIMRIGLFSYWVNSYWGGALPALAGAVFVGAMTRLCKRPSAAQATLVGVSVAVLANTRMYEGALLVAATLFSFALFGLLRNIQLGFRVVGPIVAILACTAGGMLYYNRVVFGDSLVLPYSINRTTYAPAQIFVWQKPRPTPVYRHAAMREMFAGVELDRFERFRTPFGFVVESTFKIVLFYLFFLGPLLTIPFFWMRLRDRRVAPITCIGLMLIPGSMVSAWFSPHYVSPATGVVYLLVLQSVRRLSALKVRRYRVGRFSMSMILATSALLTLIVLVACWSRSSVGAPPLSWCGWTFRGSHRSAILEQLSTDGGRHLILVESPVQTGSREYVYNQAHIDTANIVWAREMDPVSNDRLFTYFRDRQIWSFRPGRTQPHLVKLK